MRYRGATLPFSNLKVSDMLVRFSVENYLSFRDRVELSMVASTKARKHSEHVIKPNTTSGVPLLKLALLYGANASGKSNLIKAMSTAQKLVLRPLDVGSAIPHCPFKLDAACRNAPSRFEFEIKVNERSYSYGFSVTAKRVEEEWLFKINQEPERKIFERARGKIDIGDLEFADEDEEQFFRFTAKGTLPNRLFLTECRERNVRAILQKTPEISDLLNWFEDVLTIIFPETKFALLRFLRVNYAGGQEFKSELARYLKCFDTGISEIFLKSVKPETIELDEEVKQTIESQADANSLLSFEETRNSHWLSDRDSAGKLRAWKLLTRQIEFVGASTGHGDNSNRSFLAEPISVRRARTAQITRARAGS
jgi:uncharacterized protein